MTGMDQAMSVEELAAERAQCLAMLATTVREATAALAALDIDEVERCTEVQREFCEQLSAVQRMTNISAVSRTDDQHTAAFSRSLRTYATLLRRTSQWVESRHNTLRLLAGVSEPQQPSLRSRG